MKKIFFILFCCIIASQAHAYVNCYEDGYGNRNCYGTNSDGDFVNIRSSTDSFGNTDTFGTIGDDFIDTRSSRDSFGNTNTFGTIGDDFINTRSSRDSFGNTTIYGF